MIQKLWRGETLSFPGPGGEEIPITIYPRPVQKELNVWLLVSQNDGAFSYAGKQGYNIFTMLYGINLEAMGKKISLYRKGREEAGYDPETGIVSLMLHTLVHKDMKTVEDAVEKPFKKYIKSSLNAHVKATADAKAAGVAELGEDEKSKMLEYAYQRYFKTGAIFGTVEEGRQVVEEAISVGVNDIACLVDFGVDYSLVKDSFPYLKKLISPYI